VLVAAPVERAEQIAERLRSRGLESIAVPVVRFDPPTSMDLEQLDRSILHRAPYDWLVFTSARAVEAVQERCRFVGVAPGEVAARVAAVGPATAAAATRAGFTVDFVPREFTSDALAAGLGELGEGRVLLPRADLARDALPAELARRGAVIEEVVVYRTRSASATALPPLAGVDAVVLTSASSAHFLAQAVGPAAMALLAPRAQALCIGPITAQAAREVGFLHVGVAEPYTVEALIDIVVRRRVAHE
jgi:uroporphyrinogen-III synthase